MSHNDQDLSLQQLLARCKELDPLERIDLYYDPGPHHFIINYNSVLPFWIPRAAFLIGTCYAQDVGGRLELFISDAIRMINKEVKL